MMNKMKFVDLNKAQGEEYPLGSDTLIMLRADKLPNGFYLWFDIDNSDNQFSVETTKNGKIKEVIFYKDSDEIIRKDLIKGFEPVIRTIFDI